jgi:selenocysteine lyase/cysteine desulfurase
MIDLNNISQFTKDFSKNYSNFRVKERILLTGHSHQAWPDVAREGMLECWDDASNLVDLKWEKAFAQADRVRSGFAKLMNDKTGLYTLSSNTHDLVIKFLSAMDLKNRPKIITSDMEFHTVRRQLDRLSEENIEIVKVSTNDIETISERICSEIDYKTSCVIISKCFYKNGRIVENLGAIEDKCLEFGANLIVDVYHVLNIIPFDIESEGLTNSFFVGGGYKYCQLGEGNCFMRFPENCDLRPVITGWFSEFNKLADVKKTGEVAYGEGHYRFAGSTYDPVSHYRAAKVFDFFENQGLTPEILRQINLHQKGLICSKFDLNNFDKTIISRDVNNELEKSGGFVVLKTNFAAEINNKLFENNIYTDYREDHLRLGTAPYISDEQINLSMDTLSEIINKLRV